MECSHNIRLEELGYLIVSLLPTRVFNANGISIALEVFAGLTRWQTDRQTDKPRYLAGKIGGIYVRSNAMWSNNTYSIFRLLDWFPCFYRRTEPGNRRQQTSLHPRCGIARLTTCIYFLNLSPVNAEVTSLSNDHAISANRHATEDCNKRAKTGLCRGDCRLAQKFHKTKAHDKMTKLFQCYKLPINKVSFAQLFYGIVNLYIK